MRVLVVGFRKELCLVLEKKKIPYAIWANKLPKSRRGCLFAHIGPFVLDRKILVEEVKRISSRSSFSHIIAGTESGVFPAAVARETLGLKGTDTNLALRCHDKLVMKKFLRDQKIPMADFVPVAEVSDATQLIKKFDLPLILKERTSSGGRGLIKIEKPQQLQEQLGSPLIAEKFVEAEEASVESFVSNGKILFRNVTRYYKKGHTNIVPAGFSQDVTEKLLVLHDRTVSALKIDRGIVHLECFLTPKGPLFGELALRPPGGHIMELLALAYGFDAWEAYLATETANDFVFPEEAKAAAAAIVLHPGSGKIAKISGIDRLQENANVTKYSIKIRAGDRVNPRASVGEDVGYVIIQGENSREIEKTIEFVNRHLVFSFEQS